MSSPIASSPIAAVLSGAGSWPPPMASSQRDTDHLLPSNRVLILASEFVNDPRIRSVDELLAVIKLMRVTAESMVSSARAGRQAKTVMARLDRAARDE